MSKVHNAIILQDCQNFHENAKNFLLPMLILGSDESQFFSLIVLTCSTLNETFPFCFQIHIRENNYALHLLLQVCSSSKSSLLLC